MRAKKEGGVNFNGWIWTLGSHTAVPKERLHLTLLPGNTGVFTNYWNS